MNKTRYQTNFFHPFGKGVVCFLERRGCSFKSLGAYSFKEPIL
jgi:hypothetical protein